jgi:hypothetical protein
MFWQAGIRHAGSNSGSKSGRVKIDSQLGPKSIREIALALYEYSYIDDTEVGLGNNLSIKWE